MRDITVTYPDLTLPLSCPTLPCPALPLPPPALTLLGEEAEEEALRQQQLRLDEEKKTKAGEMLVYNACSEGSNMAGKILLRGEGVSFEVIDFLDTVIIRPPELCKREPPLPVGQNVQVMAYPGDMNTSI